eukprot:6445745-Prorocentrum_lima.AAC.1
MTSSLVGSEMCIRDRVASEQWLKDVDKWAMVKWLNALNRLKGTDDHVWPVSYTHLTLPTICSV